MLFRSGCVRQQISESFATLPICHSFAESHHAIDSRGGGGRLPIRNVTTSTLLLSLEVRVRTWWFSLCAFRELCRSVDEQPHSILWYTINTTIYWSVSVSHSPLDGNSKRGPYSELIFTTASTFNVVLSVVDPRRVVCVGKALSGVCIKVK